jgi:hypothetical protein
MRGLEPDADLSHCRLTDVEVEMEGAVVEHVLVVGNSDADVGIPHLRSRFCPRVDGMLSES